jgi:dienelactone hydrolase
MKRRNLAGILAAAMIVLSVALPSSASAAITSVLGGQTLSGTAISCTTQSDGVRVCSGDYSSSGGPDTRLKSFDGTPLALYVILPPAPSSGADGHYPLVVQSHGWGSQASGPGNTEYDGPTGDQWAKQGYAVLQLTARGFGDSCGSAASRLADPAAASACSNGYIRLDDDRYEVRDIQYAIGLLADEGVVDPSRIGVTGESYGGGVSLQLATLKNRIMNSNGSLSPWVSPKGTPLSVTAAAPVIPWSDLVYSLVPNGRTRDDQITSPTADLNPIGVMKQSFVSGLFALGEKSGYYAPPGTNSQADLTTWYGDLSAGEPYNTSTDQALVQQIARYHSAYYLLDGAYGTAKEPPPPLFIANGFTDDLFPVDEALRYYNLERSLYAKDPIALFDFDGGHARGQNKPAEMSLLSSRIESFFNHYVKGSGAAPPLGATALTQTCPSTALAGGPFYASTWAALHPGVVNYSSNASQTIASGSGNATISTTIDPISGKGACATVSATDQGSGVASYRLRPSTGKGYTLLGAPTVTANLAYTGTYPELAERLWDVNPSTNTETLVARGLYRVDSSGTQTFQLHPGAWHFAAGHIPKLELLGQDSPYGRASNGSFSIKVSDLRLVLPVHEVPGAPGTPPVVVHPPGTKRCIARPTSRINKRRLRVTRRRILISGTASEKPCRSAKAAARRKERVHTVWVSLSVSARHHRCRFLRANGRLTKARSCLRPVELRARGTRHWHLSRRQRVPRGRYSVRSDAVDGFHRHQRRSRAAFARVRVR